MLPPAKAIAFIGVQQGLFGFSPGTFLRTPNHKGMPVLAASEKTDFLRRQVLTSRNVRGGWLTDFAVGGLNYQIEHHLFPSMPRPNLRRSQALVAAFCAERDLPYCQASLFGSYAQALRYLNATGGFTRAAASRSSPDLRRVREPNAGLRNPRNARSQPPSGSGASSSPTRGARAVAGIDLDIRQGEIFALLGPNGAGKTTTVEILEGYRSRDAARCRVSRLRPGSRADD